MVKNLQDSIDGSDQSTFPTLQRQPKIQMAFLSAQSWIVQIHGPVTAKRSTRLCLAGFALSQVMVKCATSLSTPADPLKDGDRHCTGVIPAATERAASTVHCSSDRTPATEQAKSAQPWMASAHEQRTTGLPSKPPSPRSYQAAEAWVLCVASGCWRAFSTHLVSLAMVVSLLNHPPKTANCLISHASCPSARQHCICCF